MKNTPKRDEKLKYKSSKERISGYPRNALERMFSLVQLSSSCTLEGIASED